MKVPRSKVKTAYSYLLFCFVVLESDLSFLLTQSIFALGFVLVAGRWRATDHSRAHGPTPPNNNPKQHDTTINNDNETTHPTTTTQQRNNNHNTTTATQQPQHNHNTTQQSTTK